MPCTYSARPNLTSWLLLQLLISALNAARIPLQFQEAEFVNSNRTLYLHVHIPKSGGTTLKQELPVLFSAFKYCKLDGRDHTARFDKAISTVDYAHCNFLSFEGGYWMTKYLPQNYDIKPLALFRNPLELRISGLEHFARKRKVDPSMVLKLVEEGQSVDLISYEMQDFQAQALVCGPDSVRYHPFATCHYSLAEAAKVLDKIWWVGITELLKESLCLLAYKIGQFDPKHCECAKQQTIKRDNPWRPGPDTPGGSYTVHEIKLISELNKVDLELYGLAMARFIKECDEVAKATGVKILC